MTLGDRIKARRKELTLSQATLAELLDYKDRSTIAKIESGKNDLTQSKILQFAEHLQTTPEYLMGWTDDPYDYDIDPDSLFDDIPLDVLDGLQDAYGDDNAQIWYAWQAMQDDAAACASDPEIEHPRAFQLACQLETPTEHELKLLARHLDKIPDEQRNRLLDNFKSSIDMYLDALGISKEDE